jgi:uncharacterized damage-inducible protein DinB
MSFKKVLLRSLKDNKAILRQFLESMTEEEIHRKIKDYWTIYEHLEHLVETQQVILKRIELFIREAAPTLVPYTPDKAPEAKSSPPSTAQLLDQFDKWRDKQLDLVKNSKKETWKKSGTHPEYTRYSFEILLRHALVHDSFHMARIEQLWIMKEEFIMPLDSN